MPDMFYPSHSFQNQIFRLSIFISAILLLSLWIRSAHYSLDAFNSRSASDTAAAAAPVAPAAATTNFPWQFNPDVHSNTHTFSNKQCDIAFPELYTTLEDNIKKRNGRKIRMDEISIKEGRCMLRLMIHGGELFVVDDGMPESCYVKNGNERERILGTLAQIDRALTSSPTTDPQIPNIEFSISLDDLPRRSKETGVFWAYTRKNTTEYDDIWLMPNYAYWSWNYTHAPSWNSIRNEIMDAEKEMPWKEKDPRVVWRGKIKMAELRKELVRLSKGKDWSDIKPVVINNASDVHSRDVMNLRQFCGYKYTIQTEGTSYSGRLKYLQLCRSALITHPLQWQEFHTPLMRLSGPDINFIETMENFANLESAMEWFKQHDADAEKIASNSYNTFARRYLTPAAVTCYWRRLFWSWASMQGYEVELYTRDKKGNKIMRGVPWTAFAANWPKNPALIP